MSNARIPVPFTPNELAEFPALPEGWRWQRAFSIGGAPTLELRRKVWWGWKQEDYVHIFHTGFGEVTKAREMLVDRGFAEAWGEHTGPVQ